jgi:predicted nucleic acid-binding Zn ribbon protein
MLNRVSDAWGRLLPEQLGQHSRIAGLSGGQLKVLADSPAYVYELTLCSAELVGELQRMVPAARIQKIKVTLG